VEGKLSQCGRVMHYAHTTIPSSLILEQIEVTFAVVTLLFMYVIYFDVQQPATSLTTYEYVCDLTDSISRKGEFPLRLDYGRSPHAYVNQRLQIQLELLMMSGMSLETC